MDFAVFKELFDDFIINFLNKNPSKGKILKGRCPDEVWAEEFKVKRAISNDALKLFCMRTSRPVKIGRNGVYDSQLQVTYWGEWMIAEKGRKVFIRRDINAYQEAWVFDAKTEEYLGKANIYQEVSFLATTNVEKAVLDAKSGRVEYRTDSYGNIHCSVGKVSFDEKALIENITYVVSIITKAKPATVKGKYIQNISLSTTMGPGIKVTAE